MDRGEEVYKTIIQTLPDIVYKLDLDGIFTYINEAVCKLGYTPEELVGKHFSTIIYSKDLETVQSSSVLPQLKGKITGDLKAPQLFDERRTGKRITKKLRVRLVSKTFDNDKDTVIDGEVISIGLYDYDEETKKRAYVGTLGIIRDISELKSSEMALILAERHYRLLVESLPEIVTIIACDGTILYKSDSIKRILGYLAPQIIGENEYDFIHPDDKHILKEMLEGKGEMLDTSPLIECRFRHINGTWREFEISVKKVFDSNYRTMCFILNSLDITDRQTSKEERNAFTKIAYSRMKGVNCLHSISDLVNNPDNTLEDIYENVVNIIPLAFQHPNLTSSMVVFDDKVFKSNNFNYSRFRLFSNINVFGKEKGFIEIFYREDAAEVNGLPFLNEEEYLIESIANEMGIVAERRWSERELNESFKQLRKTLGGVIQAIAQAVEVRDSYTAGHQRRATNLARAIATKMGLPKDKIEGIRMAGRIHDLGKLSIPADILSKPSTLTDIEYTLIQEHPQIGFDILKAIEFPWPVATIVYQHHERIDGSGYPLGLEGDKILIEAKIIAVADVVEAMSSHRPYRAAIGVDKAMEEIRSNRGIAYDSDAVDACLGLFERGEFAFSDERIQ